jgi:phosphoglucomutase
MEIKFGTSGWRAIIADEFTFENVRLVSQAISDYVYLIGKEKSGIIITSDTRFLGDEFCKLAARVFAANKIKVYLTERDAPTPVCAYEIIRRKTAGGINFTASHNPPKYQGIKYSPPSGGPALPITTYWIEARIEELKFLEEKEYPDFNSLKEKGLIEIIDPRKNYLAQLNKYVDVKIIKNSGLNIIYDCMHGTGRDYLDAFLEQNKCKVKIINNNLDPTFGGLPPEPAKNNIGELIKLVKSGKNNFGVATDGDADRFGFVDFNGEVIDANQIIALLFEYLLQTRKWKGSVVRTLATTHLIDAIAEKNGITLHDVPVGFKYIGEIMTEEDIIIGGEESGGLTVYRHIPEKDGILACLLVIEMVAKRKKPLAALLNDLYKKYGFYYTARLNLHLPDAKKHKLLDKLSKNTPTEILKKKVTWIDRRDGIKMSLEDNSWLLVRFSGTEPIVRFYGEADSQKKLDALMKYAGDLAK